MRKRIAVVLLLTSVLTMAAPALASTTERSTTVTTVVERPAGDADSTPELRRFCSAKSGARSMPEYGSRQRPADDLAAHQGG